MLKAKKILFFPPHLHMENEPSAKVLDPSSLGAREIGDGSILMF